MLTVTLLAISAALTVILIASVLVSIIRTRLEYEKFKKKTKGLPMLPSNWFPGGHLHEMLFTQSAVLKAEPNHRKNGKTFGFIMDRVPVVSTLDLELIKKINTTEATTHINRLISNNHIIDEVRFDNIMTAQDDQWRRIRRSIAPSFTKHKVHSKNVTDEMDAVIGNLISNLDSRLDKAASHVSGGCADKKPSAEIDASDLMLRYSTDLVLSCFYKRYNQIDYGAEEDHFTSVIEAGLNPRLMILIEVTMLLPIIHPIARWLMKFHCFGKMRSDLNMFIRDQTALNLQARREMAAAKKAGKTFDPENFKLSDGRVFKSNMIDGFIDSFHEGKVTETEYMHSSGFLYLAGIKTVADAIARLIYYLVANQKIQEKLRNSIKKDGLESEYLSWCINESLRVTVPVPFGSSRMAERDFEVEGGGVIPKGTGIFTPVWIIHRLPEYWGEDADQFRPERWADADKFHPAQFLPFGGGLRSCPGKEFALESLRRLTRALLLRYKFERCFRTSDTPLFESPFMIYLAHYTSTVVKISRL